jgi:hypothetical protein
MTNLDEFLRTAGSIVLVDVPGLEFLLPNNLSE